MFSSIGLVSKLLGLISGNNYAYNYSEVEFLKESKQLNKQKNVKNKF